MNHFKEISRGGVFVLLLTSTLLYSTKLPYLGHNGFLWLLSLFSLVLVILNFDQVKNAVRYHRYTLLFLLLLYVWMWVSAYFSEFQGTAITFSKKYSIYVLIFVSFLVLTYKKQDRFSYYRLLLWFLIALALFGAIEYLFPAQRIFILLRPVGSLRKYPLISSLMQWPNQFGVLISTGVLLVIILYKKRSVTRLTLYLSLFLLLVAVSLSGSWNAWLVLLLGVFLGMLYKAIRLRGAFLIIGLFCFSISFFPVSANQIGLKNYNIFPLLNLFIEQSNKEFFIRNGSFEELQENLSPKQWGVSCGRNFSEPALKINTDAVDGRFSVQTITNRGPSFLFQAIPIKEWQYIYDNYKEISIRASAKTSRPSVFLGLTLQNGDTVYSGAHPGDGQWHELKLRVRMSDFSTEIHPKFVRLFINEPKSQALFDNVVLEGLGIKDSVLVTEFFEEKPDNLDADNGLLANPVNSSNNRVQLWETTIKELPENAFTGIGIQTFQVSGIGADSVKTGYLHAHNLFLNILIELGIPGLLLALIFVCSLLRKAKWNNPVVIIPVIMVFAGQMVDCFLHDFTFTTILLYFLAEAGNSWSNKDSAS